MESIISSDCSYIEVGKKVILQEATAVEDLANKLDNEFAKACKLILECRGRVIVSGMGKSGHVAAKIAATLSSTGTPAFFMNLGEAAHGDFGMVTVDDVMIIISNSGNISELAVILPFIKNLGLPLIGITGNKSSILAHNSQVLLHLAVTAEACTLGLAPTTSTTVALVMGDALAIAIQKSRGFSVTDYARSHPGGALGRRLLLKVSDVWHTGDFLPVVLKNITIADALLEMTGKKLGVVCIVDHEQKLLGIFTDGDLRRTLNNDINIKNTQISLVMNLNVKTIGQDTLLTDALFIMRESAISVLAVVNDSHNLLGVVHIHDLLRAGIC